MLEEWRDFKRHIAVSTAPLFFERRNNRDSHPIFGGIYVRLYSGFAAKVIYFRRIFPVFLRIRQEASEFLFVFGGQYVKPVVLQQLRFLRSRRDNEQP